MESSSSMTSTTGWSATPECYRQPVEWTEPPRSIREKASAAPPPAGRATLVSDRLYVAGLVVPAVALLIALVGLHAPAGIDLAPDAPPTFNADRALTLAGDIADVPDRTAGSETAAARRRLVGRRSPTSARRRRSTPSRRSRATASGSR